MSKAFASTVVAVPPPRSTPCRTALSSLAVFPSSEEELASKALRADAYETIACAWLSATTLIGLLLNALLGWWWADPVAALVLVPLIAREGLEGLRAEDSCS